MYSKLVQKWFMPHVHLEKLHALGIPLTIFKQEFKYFITITQSGVTTSTNFSIHYFFFPDFFTFYLLGKKSKQSYFIALKKSF